jgi:hypothetical protein
MKGLRKNTKTAVKANDIRAQIRTGNLPNYSITTIRLFICTVLSFSTDFLSVYS